ncbi:hypothetical protein ABZP36_003299 [Zizania latifolia]
MSMILADGLLHTLVILLRTLHAMHKRSHSPKQAQQPFGCLRAVDWPEQSFDDRRRGAGVRPWPDTQLSRRRWLRTCGGRVDDDQACGSLLSSMLTLSKAQVPICIKFLSPEANDARPPTLVSSDLPDLGGSSPWWCVLAAKPAMAWAVPSRVILFYLWLSPLVARGCSSAKLNRDEVASLFAVLQSFGGTTR